MKITKTQLKQIIREEVKKSKLNEATELFTYEDVLTAQKIAASSHLNYEEGWDAITAYLVATMGLAKAKQITSSAEKQYKKVMKD